MESAAPPSVEIRRIETSDFLDVGELISRATGRSRFEAEEFLRLLADQHSDGLIAIAEGRIPVGCVFLTGSNPVIVHGLAAAPESPGILGTLVKAAVAFAGERNPATELAAPIGEDDDLLESVLAEQGFILFLDDPNWGRLALHPGGEPGTFSDGAQPEEAPDAPSKPPLPPTRPRPDLEFVSDEAQVEHDALGRGKLAIILARRLHAMWRQLNIGRGGHGDDAGAGFVVHLDAPWGGGKTTFANFVARVLNPYGYDRRAARFLTDHYGEDANLSAIFAADPPTRDTVPAIPADARRPWIVVEYNAWRMEDCNPPWWAFYQAIRKACFTAIRKDGDQPADLGPDGPRTPQPGDEGLIRWVQLWALELAWRLLTPSVIVPLAGAALTGLAILALNLLALIKPSEKGLVADLTTPAGVILGGLGTLTLVSAAASLLVKSVAPGVNPLAERLGLGGGDPLERFRRHFHKTLERVRRPVLVVVDDLDRCKPAVIVSLVRGMQTILRSPRIAFLILGDRDWIEQAFETEHAAMSKVAVGAERSLGGRFAEKAIQMSFLLPGMKPEQQADYVRGLVSPRAVGTDDEAARELRRAEQRLRTSHRSEGVSSLAEAVRHYREALEIYRTLDGSPDAGRDKDLGDLGARLNELGDRKVAEVFAEERAIQASVEQESEETAKRLLPLAPWLPTNPRQIKRILNGVTLYEHAALLQQAFADETAEMQEVRQRQLDIWIVLMTEWPRTWRLLAETPELADLVAAEAKATADAAGAATTSPLTPVARRIAADPALKALITGAGGRAGSALDAGAIRVLLTLTPLHVRATRPDAPTTPPPAAS